MFLDITASHMKTIFDLLSYFQDHADLSAGETEHKAIKAIEPTEKQIKQTQLSCRLCNSAFISLQEYRSHFKTALHINALSQSLNVQADGESDVTSVAAPSSPYLKIEAYEKAYYVYRCIFPIDVSGRTLQALLQEVASSQWAICLTRNGYTAFAIARLSDMQLITTKCMKRYSRGTDRGRYTIRRSQGGSQSSKDKTGARAISAGANLRRRNEGELIKVSLFLLPPKDVGVLLKEWKNEIDGCAIVFWNRTDFGRRCLFDNHAGSLNKGALIDSLCIDDARLKTIPFTTYRPGLKELRRCFVELTKIKEAE